MKLIVRYASMLGCFVLGSCSSDSSGPSTGSTVPPAQQNVFRLERVRLDRLADGTVDEVFELVFSAQGLSTGELIDDDADGVVDHRFTYQYADGSLISSQYDRFDDGSIDITRVFSYQPSGHIATLAVNDALTAAQLSLTRYSFDDSGRISSSTIDTDNDGLPESSSTFIHDTAGRLATIFTDSNLDNLDDSRVSYNYDAQGKVISRELDSDLNGVTDEVAIYEYSETLCDASSNHQPFAHICIFD